MWNRSWLRASVVAVAACSVVVAGALSASAPHAVADDAGSLRGQAAALLSEINQANASIGAAENTYNAAEWHLSQINSQISTIRSQIQSERSQVSSNQQTLRSDAINAYVNDGTPTGSTGADESAAQAADAQLYGSVAASNLSVDVDKLTTSQDTLASQQATLQQAQHQASVDVSIASNAVASANATKNQLASDLSRVQGRLAQVLAQERQAAEEAQQAASRAQLAAAREAAAAATSSESQGSGASVGGGSISVSNPPPSSVGEAAVQAAESFLGVPYVWGGASRSGVDCSGLVMLAYEAVGISLPHYSGAQMADSTPVPLSDLEPGDLLFYGPGGSEHVAMYVGGGMMIEAPYTGAVVHITPIRLGYGFAGAGRP